ncbi:histidine phosphatase family protein [Sphingomonas glacialis]|uniref:Histidine phosphatase family protein n=1 Tax=Sphingomonas glacialis TaxID=658225 RepID=A0A502FF94_9SPHN|nr:histidine phosphatase family protein [Sphingomonas glacialis]TPG48041.1 histidine phosphatase family protein [Sphingomonas glacialis]
MTALPRIHLVRHGETAWSLSGKHTGRSDIPLTEIGQRAAEGLGRNLSGLHFAEIWSSPSQRALQTARLAGFGRDAIPDYDLAEWDYGAYEGMTTKEILAENPDWRLFRDGCPQGETPDAVAARADRVVDRIRDLHDSVLIFSSSHILRVLTARWLSLPARNGALFMLDTASISTLGYEHDLNEPIVQTWNRT